MPSDLRDYLREQSDLTSDAVAPAMALCYVLGIQAERHFAAASATDWQGMTGLPPLGGIEYPEYYWRGYWEHSRAWDAGADPNNYGAGSGPGAGRLSVRGALNAFDIPEGRSQGPRAFLRGSYRVLCGFLDWLDLEGVEYRPDHRHAATVGRLTFAAFETVAIVAKLYDSDELATNPEYLAKALHVLRYSPEHAMVLDTERRRKQEHQKLLQWQEARTNPTADQKNP